jgi:hypothetical protein
VLGPLAGPTFATGQHQWVGITTAGSPNFSRLTVQSERAHTGLAAVKFDAAGHPTEPSVRVELYRGTGFAVERRFMVIDVDLYWQSGTAQSDKWVLTCQQGPIFPLTALALYEDGHMTGDDWIAGVPVKLSGTFARDTWNAVRLVVDYQAEQVDFALNGQSIGSVGFPNLNSFGLIGLFLYDRADDAMYMDNLRIVNTDGAAPCYADCDADESLTLADFGCFQTKFALGDPYADCNGDQTLNLADFGCFQTAFAVGCP